MRKSITIFTIILLALFMISCENTENPFRSETQYENDGTSLEKKGGKNAVNTIFLTGDVITDETIYIEEGWTLDGKGHTITAIDPDGGHFVGAVVMNEGSIAHVKNLNVTAENLANVGDGGANRLRGIMFEGASGTITNCNVYGINQGESGAQEGNGIEIRNAPFDGTHPGTVNVLVKNCTVYDYQKTGIVANGDVKVELYNNKIGDSATQANLAANSVQFGYGATGAIERNQIDGNQWLGASNWGSTAILIFLANDIDIIQNNIRGNSEIGIYGYGNNLSIINNKVFDVGEDVATHSYDIGLGNWGENNIVKNNKVKGFDTPYDGVTGGNNKAIPGGPID